MREFSTCTPPSFFPQLPHSFLSRKMSMRYTQPKDVAAKHTEVLKAMLKRPENKVCPFAPCASHSSSLSADQTVVRGLQAKR